MEDELRTGEVANGFKHVASSLQSIKQRLNELEDRLEENK